MHVEFELLVLDTDRGLRRKKWKNKCKSREYTGFNYGSGCESREREFKLKKKKKKEIKTKISGALGFKEQVGGHSLPGRLEWSSREAGVKTRKEGLVSKNNKTTEVSEGNVESCRMLEDTKEIYGHKQSSWI